MVSRTLLPNSSQANKSPAGLVNDVPVPFTWITEYSDVDNPRLDDIWQFDGIFDYGMIALTEDERGSMSLLPSEQVFPWEPETKSLYHLNGHHGLHCLVSTVHNSLPGVSLSGQSKAARAQLTFRPLQRLIYTSISSYRASTPQKTAFAHVLHCLDSLRQDVICNADDSPRYLTNNGSHSGESQVRFCRNFSKLNDWAKEHDACFRQQHDLADDMPVIEKYKYCKNEEAKERYIDRVRGYFNLPSDWKFPDTPVPIL